jgi:hypothetical protein
MIRQVDPCRERSTAAVCAPVQSLGDCMIEVIVKIGEIDMATRLEETLQSISYASELYSALF